MSQPMQEEGVELTPEQEDNFEKITEVLFHWETKLVAIPAVLDGAQPVVIIGRLVNENEDDFDFNPLVLVLDPQLLDRLTMPGMQKTTPTEGGNDGEAGAQGDQSGSS